MSRAFHGVTRNKPGQHAWLPAGSVSPVRGLWKCRKCGTVVETCAAFPDSSQSEKWNGTPMRKRQARPACGA